MFLSNAIQPPVLNIRIVFCFRENDIFLQNILEYEMEKGMKLEPATGRCERSFVKILKLITLIRILLSDSQSRAHFSLSRVIRTNDNYNYKRDLFF